MSRLQVTNLGGVDQYTNPLNTEGAVLLHGVNVESTTYGVKTKRGGYSTHLGTADGSAVNTLFSWTKEDGSLYLYRASGTKLYYSTEGTGAWTVMGNGTIAAGNHVGHAVLGDTLILGDGSGSTRHTTNGTSLTDTTLAPVGEHFTQYQRRVYIGGTSSDLFYSTSNDATNWSTGGTSDSSSFTIPGEGKINKVVNANDRIVATKTSGMMNRWDGDSLTDMSTRAGPSSPYSVAEKEGYYFWMNRDGIQGYGGSRPELLSNPIQPLIYNASGSAILGSNFGTIPATVYRYDYLAAVGTTTSNLTNYTIDDTILKYDFQKNEYLTWSFNDPPTAMHSYTDANGTTRLIFGDANGQCYHYDGTALLDNTSPINVDMEFLITANAPDIDKKWRWITLFFNPGCEAKVSVAPSDTFIKENKRWTVIGDCSSGICSTRVPSKRSKLLYVKISESSKASRFSFYGFVSDYEYVNSP